MENHQTAQTGSRLAFRRLRIAFSTACAVAIALLLVLWIRSYYRWDIFCVLTGNGTGHWLRSYKGEIAYDPTADLSQTTFLRWIVHDFEEWPESDFEPEWSMLGFHWERQGIPVVPDWFPISMCIVIGAVPWIQWWRFRLSTLLVAMTVTAVMLWVAVTFWNAKPEPTVQTFDPSSEGF